METSYNGLVDYIGRNKHWADRYAKTPIYKDKYGNGDDYYLYRAINVGNIPQPNKNISQYNHIAEYLIHKVIWDLQEEFKNHDTRNFAVREWFNKKRRNTLNKINRIRIDNWYHKPISMFIR